MHNQVKRVPTYRLKKAAGGRKYAVVSLPDGRGGRRDFILGQYGSKESRIEYSRKLAEWEAANRTLPQTDEAAPLDLTVNEMLLKYWEHAQTYYRRPDGTATNELSEIRLSLKPLRELYGFVSARKIGPLALEKIRDRWIKQPITTKIKKLDATGQIIEREKILRVGLARGVINSRLDRIRRAFRWAASKELVDVRVYQALMTLDNLQAGRSEARETQRIKPVSLALVEDTLPHLSATVADIVRLLLLTGMRTGEAASMRACEIDMTGPVWLYRPSHHKTAHKEIDRTIAIGPRAQEIIKRHLRPDTQAYLFSPKQAVADFRIKQRQERKTKVQPSQLNRKKRRPRRTPGDHYTTAALSGAIWRACQRSGLEAWHLHQLRHTAATLVRKQFGLDHARSALGHRSASITLDYAELDQGKAVEVAAKLG